jgi:antitoxin (DNA-binding transcriptional repressor) of toxin-antitoxin stability system
MHALPHDRLSTENDLVVDLVDRVPYAGSMREVGVHEAKTTLSRLIREVEAGAEIVIRRGGRAVARLVPLHQREARVLGQDAGILSVPDDFDAPLPDDVLDDFET